MMKTSTTEKVCPHCRKTKPLAHYLRRGSNAETIRHNRVGEAYGRCKDCRRSEKDTSPRAYLIALLNASHQRRLSAAPQRITVEHLQFILQKQNGICPLTGLRLTFSRGSGRVWTNASIDRIDPSKGYDQGNVRLVTYWSNVARNSLTDDDFFYFCNLVADRMKRRSFRQE